MPTMRPPRRGISISEALARAYASAPEDEVIVETLEFRHPVIRDAGGTPIARRIVCAHEDLEATLEDNAPMNPGAVCAFERCFFTIKRQSESDGGRVPELTIAISNVNRILMPYLEAQVGSRDPVQVTYRPYMLSDLTGPHMDPPIELVCRTFTADMTSVTIRAGFATLTNRRFPAVEYTAKNFPQLTAR